MGLLPKTWCPTQNYITTSYIKLDLPKIRKINQKILLPFLDSSKSSTSKQKKGDSLSLYPTWSWSCILFHVLLLWIVFLPHIQNRSCHCGEYCSEHYDFSSNYLGWSCCRWVCFQIYHCWLFLMMHGSLHCRNLTCIHYFYVTLLSNSGERGV